MNRAVGVVDVPGSDGDESRSPRRSWLRTVRFLPELAALLATIWVFRGVLRGGLLPGDIGDARWTIGLHEHWYRVWRGADPIRDLFYYFPLRNTLGTSDAFLVQGQFYSLARLLGFGVVDSWVIAGFVFFLIGALGIAVMAKQLLDHLAAQVAMVVLTVASYPVLVGFGHVQLFGLLSVSWVFVGLHDVISRRHLRRGVALLALVPPLLGLSSWYGLALGGIVIAFLGLALLLVSSGSGIRLVARQIGADLWTVLRSRTGVVLSILFVLLWASLLWIYLPSRTLMPRPEWLDVHIYSPRWSDILNAKDGGGGIWAPLYARFPELGQSVPEQARGFTPILIAAFAVASIAVFRWVLARGWATAHGPATGWSVVARPGGSAALVGPAGLLAAALTVPAVIALFMIDERGYSLFRFFWLVVPGMEAVRSPYRVTTILYGFAVFVILRTLELWWRRSSSLSTVRWRRLTFLTGSSLLVLLVFVEMQRTVDTHWTRADLLSPALTAQVEPARQACDAVIVLPENPDAPVWQNPVDAVVFSTLSGVPTPQGYSRADPVGYPGPVTGTDAAALAGWMRDQGFDGRICTVSSGGVQQISG